MHRFYVTDLCDANDTITITGSDVNHIKNVLRLTIDDEIVISDGCGRDYYCNISNITPTEVLCNINDIIKNASELNTRIILFQGMPKADKMEFIIQKAVELGVSEIVPVITKRTVVKVDAKKESKKIDRFNTIAESAAKQAGRGIVPVVNSFMSFKEAIKYAKTLSMNIIPYEEAEGIEYSRSVISSVKGKESLGIFIGPEGGFAKEEIDMAFDNDIKSITLGKRILRTETAGLTTLSIVMYAIEED